MDIRSKILLIVDDEVDLCQILAWDFEDEGMKVRQAGSGNEALKILETEKIDFVLSDMKMSDGNGIELLEQIFDKKISLLGFFLMSGYSDYAEDKLIKLGMNKLFKKPINTKELLVEFQKLSTK